MSSAARVSPGSQVHITAVIVLFNRLPAQSEAYITLQAALMAARGSDLNLTLLIADNTPQPGNRATLPEAVTYRAAPRNEGLAAAYNWALDHAEQNGSTWLLTLDQDTHLPETFLLDLASLVREVERTPVIAAVVPQVIAGDRIVSPYRFRAGAMPVWFDKGFVGVPQERVFAFNSGALLRVSALRQVGGYDPWFWLDNSDAFLFHQLHRFGKRVLVAGRIQVLHDFSMQDLSNRVSPARYRNILLAESALWDQVMNSAAGWERTARLLLRAVRQALHPDQATLRAITFDFLKRRLLLSRSRRNRIWKSEMKQLFPELEQPRRAPSTRPKVSVCMAAYNSDRYIEEQIRSIIPQLQPQDEIVIVDDASTDCTPQVIRSLDYPLIRLICRSKNQGVVATVEEALRNATGDILFLSDGDDIWAADKVEQFLHTFAHHLDVDLVTSHIRFIDGTGAPIESELYRHRATFKPGFWANLLHNHFQGSAMALRASRLHTVLPFPRGVLFLHDHWIGMRNALAGRSAICLKEPLLLYRRHGQNFSGRFARSKQIKLRLQLLRSHLLAAILGRA